MSHYFMPDSELKPKSFSIQYAFKGKSYAFRSDTGVFSARKADAATDLLLQNLPALRGSLLDMGCVYGLIGIVLAKEYALTLTQADINPKAVDLARENAERNRVASKTVLSDCFEKVGGSFDTVIINPPIHAGKSVVYRMYDGARAHLNEGGVLYVVIQKKHGAESTVQKLRDTFGHCAVLYKKKGYYVLACENPPHATEAPE